MRPRVLFLCTHNSARSQMAEGLLRHLAGDRFDAASAGTVATAVRPEAVAVMGEIGIDISGHRSKSLQNLLAHGDTFDVVITVCDEAAEACPVFPGATTVLHWPVPDPSGACGDEAVRLEAFRRARDQLRRRIEDWLAGTC